MSEYVHKSHNVSVLMYHWYFPKNTDVLYLVIQWMKSLRKHLWSWESVMRSNFLRSERRKTMSIFWFGRFWFIVSLN